MFQICKFAALQCFALLEIYSFVNPSAPASLQLTAYITACIFTPSWFAVSHPEHAPLPSTGWGLRIWGSPGNPRNFDKLSTIFRHPKLTPRGPKTSKMTPGAVPGDTQLDVSTKMKSIDNRDIFNVFATYSFPEEIMFLTKSMNKKISNSTCHGGIQDHKFESRRSTK